jgi:peptidoglycan/xylan/chitin deacetylase (PgdA/CDA1 family)
MRIPGLKSLKRTSRMLRGRLVNGALILGYHRITNTTLDPYDICVHHDDFEEQLKVISRAANPIRLQDLVRSLKNRHLPSKSVVITFDDGYSDILYEAKPVIEKYRIPVTVFVTTGNIGKEFWWDELYRIIYTSPGLPDEFVLKQEGDRHQWRFNRNYEEEDITYRERVLKTLHKLILEMTKNDRDNLMAQLRAGIGPDLDPTPTSRCLTWEEIEKLGGNDLFDFGSHSNDHVSFPVLPLEEKIRQLSTSKSRLEECLGKPLFGFSYPLGLNTRIDRQAVLAAGFECACSSTNDIVRIQSDLYQLPRFWLTNWGEQQTHKLLRWWLLH